MPISFSDVSIGAPRIALSRLRTLALAAALATLAVGCESRENENAARDPDAGAAPADTHAPSPHGAPIALRDVAEFPGEPGALAGCNLLLVTLDTTRADHIGCYGYERIETPTLDRLAAEGVLFQEATAVAPTTLAAHSSILTGLYPAHHGARVNWFYRLDDKVQTLAETLGDDGYQTAAFVSAFVLLSRFGVAQGFDYFDDDLSAGAPTPQAQGQHAEVAERRGDLTTRRALQWLRNAADRRFFMWVHYFDPHAPHAAPRPFADKYKDNPYDGEIAFADAMLGKLIETLDELKLADNTLIVVVGDHGEGLGQHDELSHGMLTYESTMRVPLIMRCGRRLGGGVRIARRVSQVDIVPTVLALLGASPPNRVDGADLTRKPVAERPLFIETLHGLVYHGWAPIVGVYQGDLKYIESPHPELYNLALDPDELNNLYTSRPKIAANLRNVLPQLFGPDLELAEAADAGARPANADLRKLEALGYIGGAGDTSNAGERRDPKEMVPLLDKLFAAVQADAPDQTIAAVRPIVAKYPDFHAAWKYLAQAYRRKGDLKHAAEAYERCHELLPDAPETAYDLALVKLDLGELDAAIPLLEGVVAKYEGHLAARYELATTFYRLGRYEDAARQMTRVFEIDPEYEECPAAMTAFYSKTGREDELLALFRKRLADQPRSPRVRVALAAALGRRGEFAQSETLLRQGVALSPDNARCAKAWAALLASCPDESIHDVPAAVAVLEHYRKQAKTPDASALYSLAVLYASEKRFEDAVATAIRAKTLADRTGAQALADQLDRLLTSLRAQPSDNRPPSKPKP